MSTPPDAERTPPATVIHAGGLAPAVRAGGRVLVAAAVLVVVAVLLAVLVGGSGAARTFTEVLVGIAVVAALVAGARVVAVARGRGPRLVLTADGFENRTRPRWLSRGDVRAGRWADVRSIEAVREGGRRLLVITVADARHSVIILRRLTTPPADIERDIQLRLDIANGYRDYGLLTAPPKAPRPGRP